MRILFLFALGMLMHPVSAQQIRFPAIIHQMAYFIDTTNIVLLEVKTVKVERDSSLSIELPQSPIKLKGKKMNFIVNFRSARDRLETQFYIFPLRAEKGRRLLRKKDLAVLSGANDPSKRDFFMLTQGPTGLALGLPDMPPGEYAFLMSNNLNQLQAFSVY